MAAAKKTFLLGFWIQAALVTMLSAKSHESTTISSVTTQVLTSPSSESSFSSSSTTSSNGQLQSFSPTSPTGPAPSSYLSPSTLAMTTILSTPSFSPTPVTSSTTLTSTTSSTSTTASTTSSTSIKSSTAATTPVTTETSKSSTEAASSGRGPASSSSDGTGSASSHNALVIGLAVGVPCFVLLLVLAIVLPIVLSRRNKKRDSGLTTNVLLGTLEKVRGTDNAAFQRTLSGDEPEAFGDIPEMAPRPIKLNELLAHVQSHQLDMNKYRTEFNLLPGPGIKSCSAGKKLPTKNRYINILPFNDNRVCLSSGSDSDYINASYIDGYVQKKEYIATQGPMENTVNDFWLMIWEQDCHRIVMVTKIFEGEKLKCVQYWPAPLSPTETQYGALSVLTLKEEAGDDFTTRTLQVRKGEVRRLVTQYHFQTWPDQDVPDTCTSMLKFHQLIVKTEQDQPIAGPIVIHCSAGVGRTGTLIALDILLQQAKHEGFIDIQKCIERLRLQRVNMVQSTAQYIFLHHALLEALIARNVDVKNAEFKQFYAELSRSESGGTNGPRKLTQQLKVLDALKQQFPPFLYSQALMEKNRSKNRTPNLLPVDSYVPVLKSVDGHADSSYINAVYVHGFRQQSAYIATQMPMVGTTAEFWRLVRDSNCTAIVMLNDLATRAEQYWPEDGRTITVADLEITNMCEIRSESITVTDLRVVHNGKVSSRQGSDSSDPGPSSTSEPDEPLYANAPARRQAASNARQVRHIRLLDWPADAPFPRDRATLLELYGEVVRCQSKNPEGGKVIVHCLYGADRTGLFCALMNVLDEVKQECVVDIFNSVKRVRRTRPEFITNTEQYKYLHELASAYLSGLEQEDYPDSLIDNAKL